MNKLSKAKHALDLFLFGDQQFFIDHELEISDYLVESFDSKDPDLLPLCFHLSRFSFIRKEIFSFSDVADLMIEEYFDADLALEEAVALFEEDLKLRVSSPLWHLLARSSFCNSSAFKKMILSSFQVEPSFLSEVMAKTQDRGFIPSLEKKLRDLAPFVKYLPILRDSHEFLWEHDFWLRGGNSFLNLLDDGLARVPRLQSEVLAKLFLDSLPEEVDVWFDTISPDEKHVFKARSDFYFEHLKR